MERKCQSHPLNHKKRTFSHLIWLNRYFRGVDGPRKAKQSTGLFLCRSFFAFGSNSLPCYPNLTPLTTKKEHLTMFFFGGRGWIRTTEAITQQIYSLPPLAAREPFHILKCLVGLQGLEPRTNRL